MFIFVTLMDPFREGGEQGRAEEEDSSLRSGERARFASSRSVRAWLSSSTVIMGCWSSSSDSKSARRSSREGDARGDGDGDCEGDDDGDCDCDCN